MAFLSRIKKLASETAIYGVSTIVGRLVNYLLVPLYLGFFDPELYGVVVLVYTSFLVLNHVYQHGVESAYLKYASGKEGRAQITQVFSTATWSLVAVGGLFSIVIVWSGDLLSEVVGIGSSWSFLWYYAVAILSLDALVIVPFAELRLQNRPLYFVTIKMANILINVGLNIWLIVGLRYGIEAIFISNLVASACTFLLLLPLYARLCRLQFEGVLWRQLLAFGLPFVPSGLSYAFVDRVNVFFLGAMTDERILALYQDVIPPEKLNSTSESVLGAYVAGIFGAVWKLGVFMMLVVQMFRFAWQPFFLQHASDNDAPSLFSRVFTIYTAGGVFVLLAVSMLIDNLVAIPVPGGRTLIPDPYWFALYLVPVALLAYFFQGWYYNFTAGAYIEKKTSYFMVCTFAGAILALLLNIALIPLYGMVAAAWATTVAYALMAILLYGMVRRIYPVPYNWTAVAITLGWGVVLYGLWWQTPASSHWAFELIILFVYLVGVFVFRILPFSAALRILKIR